MKKIMSLLMVAVMAITTLSVPVSAAEAVEAVEEPVMVYSFEIDPNSDESIMVLSDEVDQTFNMTTSHRGADRTFAGSNLRYVVTITDANGNAVDNTVVVKLNDYNSGTIHSLNAKANGTSYGNDVPITPGRTYYFTYTKISGTTRTLRVNMYFYSHN